MSDVSAVLLTTGEAYTERAVRSVERQEPPVAELILVESLTPVHRALNAGLARVRTEFFVQVDADMILVESCVEQLREAMTEKAGIAVGGLRDALSGVEAGVKLFRRACVDKDGFAASISPDTDLYAGGRRRGWEFPYVVSAVYQPASIWPALGEHKPDYNPRYTHSRFYRLGARYAYRKDPIGLQWRFRMLRRSTHPAAKRAEIALGHGLFSGIESDFLEPPSVDHDLAFLGDFLDSRGECEIGSCAAVAAGSEPERVFAEFLGLGTRLREAGAYPSVERCLLVLDDVQSCWDWLARAALCHGLFSPDQSSARRALATVRELLPYIRHGGPMTGHYQRL